MSEWHRSLFEGATNGQMWGNLNNNIMIVVDYITHRKKIRIHEPILIKTNNLKINKGEEEAFPYCTISTNKHRRKDRIQNSPFGKHHSNNWIASESSKDAKNSGWIYGADRTFNLKLSPHKISIIYKRKNNCTREVWQIPPWPSEVPVKGFVIILTFTPKMYRWNLIRRDHQTNPNWGIFYKINGLHFQSIKVMNDRDRPRNCVE